MHKVVHGVRPVVEGARVRQSVGWLLVGAALIIYWLGCAAFFPKVMTNSDEAIYVRQALLFARGRLAMDLESPFREEVIPFRPSDYPPGTSLWMTPFVAIFGWRGGIASSTVALTVLVLGTAAWLAVAGRPVVFALEALLFVPLLVFGRLGLSDVPSGAIVSMTLLLFWAGLVSPQRTAWWLGSGFLAGLSLLFRESNFIPVLPFYVGALVRRDTHVWALVIGGLSGACFRPWLALWLFEDPLFLRHSGYGFGWAAFIDHLPIYLITTTVLLPAGLLCVAFYRGARWPELIVAVFTFVAFYSFYEYSGQKSGGLKGFVLTARFMIPIVPLIVFASADVVSRWWIDWGGRIAIVSRVSPMVLALTLLACTALLSTGIHAYIAHWGATQAEIRDMLYDNTQEGEVVVSNLVATRKFLNEIYGDRIVVDTVTLSEPDYGRLLEGRQYYYLSLLDRAGSAFWEEKQAELNQQVLASADAQGRLHLLVNKQFDTGERLRIWRVERRSSIRNGQAKEQD